MDHGWSQPVGFYQFQRTLFKFDFSINSGFSADSLSIFRNIFFFKFFFLTRTVGPLIVNSLRSKSPLYIQHSFMPFQ